MRSGVRASEVNHPVCPSLSRTDRKRFQPWLVISLLLFASCRCVEDPGLTPVEPAQLVATPARVTFPATYVGQRATESVELTNRGGASAIVTPFIDAPFSVSSAELSLVRGQSETVRFDFVPTRAGSFSGVLRLGELEVRVDASALDVPECVASAVCTVSAFDFATEVCRESVQADGTACETRCIAGACVQGECIGGLRGCDDADACTIDACSETSGCSHSPRTCPAVTDPCKVATCDPLTGCGAEPIPDGTLCGPDECKALQVDVCLAGECVKRPRPMTGRCANRWVPTTNPPRRAHAMAYDSARQRVVLFGGAGPLGDTWEWDGARWTLRLPANSPPARAHHAMAYDAVRRRVVLFGGRDEHDQPLDDTWEWDGTNWVRRFVNASPAARSEHAMAWDAARQRVLLVSGLSSNGPLQDLWEWNGGTWLLRTSTAAPPARHGHTIAWDPDRLRLVLFGGLAGAQFFSDTWEWDGATWADRSTSQPVWLAPSARAYATLGYDLFAHRMLLIGGRLPDGRSVGETWEWDGTNWAYTNFAIPYLRSQHALATDTERSRLVVFGGSETGSASLAATVEWDGALWRSFPGSGPGAVESPAMASDPLRKRVQLFHGRTLMEWDGSEWLGRPGRSPPDRYGAAMAFDSARQRLVLVGGFLTPSLASVGDPRDDTWEWDGGAWFDRTTSPRPPARGLHQMVYDSARQHVLVTGGLDTDGGLSDTWSWNGTAWSLLSSSAPVFDRPALAFDEARQRALLFGGAAGETWTWNGAQWQRQQPASAPSGRRAHAMAYDVAGARVVLFGGEADGGLLDDTWAWDGTTWTKLSPLTSPPPSAGHGMAWDPAGERVLLQADGVTWLFLP